MFLAPQGVHGPLRAFEDPILDFFILIRSKKNKISEQVYKNWERGKFFISFILGDRWQHRGAQVGPKKGPLGVHIPWKQ